MPQLKQKSPEQFVAQPPIGEKLLGVFERNLASGALRLVAVNGEPQDHRKLNNEQAKIQETLESGYLVLFTRTIRTMSSLVRKLITSSLLTMMCQSRIMSCKNASLASVGMVT